MTQHNLWAFAKCESPRTFIDGEQILVSSSTDWTLHGKKVRRKMNEFQNRNFGHSYSISLNVTKSEFCRFSLTSIAIEFQMETINVFLQLQMDGNGRLRISFEFTSIVNRINSIKWCSLLFIALAECDWSRCDIKWIWLNQTMWFIEIPKRPAWFHDGLI